MRAVKFSNGAQWHISQPTPYADFAWQDLPTDGETDMVKPLALVAKQLKMPPMSERALPPVLVLISDGQPTDDFDKGLKDLLDQPWGKKAVRIAISIGQDADAEVLQKFIAHPEMKPLAANSPEALVKHIKWASTAVLKSASSPAAGGTDHPAASPAAAGSPVGVPAPDASIPDPNAAAATTNNAPTTGAAVPTATDPSDDQKTIDDVW